MRRIIHNLTEFAIVTATRLLSGMRARWLGCTPEACPRVYFANHSSHLDTTVIWAALPASIRGRTRPVAAGDYWLKSAFRRYVVQEVFRAILVNRNRTGTGHESIELMAQALEQGDSIIIFPEGTRGTGAEVGPFKSGLFHLARRCPNVELVPVYLENLSRILPKGELLPVPLLGSVSFGSPITLDPGEDRKAFLTRARASLLTVGSCLCQ